MALRLLGRKLMIVKPQKLGFDFRNSSRTAVVHDNPPSDSDARIRPSVNLVMEYYARPDQYEDDVLGENQRLNEENRRLKAENIQLIENRQLKEENRWLIERRVEFIAFDTSLFFSILTLGLFSYRLKTVEEEIRGDLQHDTNKEENRRLKEENRQLIENCLLKEKNRLLIENRQLIERLKPVEEETIGDLQCDTHKDDASTTINELSENVTRLEQKILGDLQHNIQNERDRCKSLETKLEKALRKIEEMNKEITKLKLEKALRKIEEMSKEITKLKQGHDGLKKEEVPRLKKENCQLKERLKSMEEILICHLQEENRQLKERLKQMGEDIVGDLQRDTQKLEEASRKIEEMNKENLITKLKEEKNRQLKKEKEDNRQLEEENRQLKESSVILKEAASLQLYRYRSSFHSTNKQMEKELERLRRQNDLMDEELEEARRLEKTKFHSLPVPIWICFKLISGLECLLDAAWFANEEKSRQLKEDNRQSEEENRQLKERLKQMEEEIRGDLQPHTQKLSAIYTQVDTDDASNTINELFEKVTLLEQRYLGDVQRDILNEFNSLKTKFEEASQKIEEASQKIAEMNGVGKDLIDILSEEREWQDINKKENPRTKLKGDSSNTINELFEKVTPLEKSMVGDVLHDVQN
ncbi:hypothetical protein RHMOL_Rhmol12G0210000 [Rhododendron molle]|uniref:Uncharacterized protein n=1 Tax=Rhododendron molle TaxID=49168 RepID=A0ACC0LKH5_RHOML|nr:hypothetical protein RHMOL_Rhmol12G0210000 [Rhododendron molle]